MNIVLIGFMGSGKTTIGKAIAAQKNFKLMDTDELIEQNQTMSIKDIFSKLGEEHFRMLEKQTIENLTGLDDCVISVGGGAVMFHNNLENLKRIGTTVFLDAPFSKILKNLKGKFRPLVGNTIDENKLKELLDYRYPIYKKADIVVETDELSIQQTVDEIIRRLGL